MTLNGVIALILLYFTEFDSFVGLLHHLLAAFRLNLVVVAVLRDRLLWGWAFFFKYNKRGLCYVMLCDLGWR